jgi:hypothetical protein
MRKLVLAFFVMLAFISYATAKGLPFVYGPVKLPATSKAAGAKANHDFRVKFEVKKGKSFGKKQVQYAWHLWADGCWHLYVGVSVTELDPVTGLPQTGVLWFSLDEDNGWVGIHTVCNNSSWNNYC